MTDCPGGGLIIAADNITLDCDGHTIDGSGGGSGIYVSWHSWDTIKNCVVTGFSEGIRLSGSNNSLMDNAVNSNGGLGIILPDSSNTTLANNIVNSNGDGIVLSGSNDTITGNTIRDNAGTGLFVIGSNTITNNTIRNNSATGLDLSVWTSGSTLGSNVVCSNKLDISSPGSNSGDDNTCMSTNNWNDDGTTGCTFSCPLEPVCYCSTCSECNDKLADDCAVVRLTADILDQSETCISQSSTFNGEVFDCQGHTIDGSGGGSGISVGGRSWDTIKNCVVTGFSEGIRLSGSNNSLMDNAVNSNGGLGIILPDSSNTTLANNIVNSNGDGIVLSGSNDTITGNTIRDNAGTGLFVIGSNTITNNYFSNAQNASASGTNTWNIAKTPGPNIIGGPYLGGNYWSDYAGVDTNGDGLGDTNLPYNANGNIQNGGDYAPLVPVSAVGGIAELPDLSDASACNRTALALLTAAALVALTAGAWYARRRWPT